MKIPRDVTGADLAKKLKKLGYKQTRQTGSHLRLTTEENGDHHITIPLHNPLKNRHIFEYIKRHRRTF